MMKKILLFGLALLPAVVSAETVSGQYISKEKSDVSLSIKRIGKVVHPNKKGAFSLRNAEIDTDTLVVESARFNVPIFFPLKGTTIVVINEQADQLDVTQKMPPLDFPSSYNGIIVSKADLERTGERMTLTAVNSKVPRQNSATTFNGNTEPLYFLDGLLVNDISTMPLSEVAYVEVVRPSNPECAAMGARGANGMILVTSETKYHTENPNWDEPREFTIHIPIKVTDSATK